MNWNGTDLLSLTVIDIKTLLRNRGASSTECARNKNVLIDLLKQNYAIDTLPWALKDYTVKSIKAELKLRNLQSNGCKSFLIQRLADYMSTNNENNATPSNRNRNRKRRRNENTEHNVTASKRRRISITSPTHTNHNHIPISSPSVDIQIIEANKCTQCPLTQSKFKLPFKSSRCNHTFELYAIRNYIKIKQKEMKFNCNHQYGQTQSVECPVFGCSQLICDTDLVMDVEMVELMKNDAKNNNNNKNNANILDWTDLSDGECDTNYDESNDDEEYIDGCEDPMARLRLLLGLH